MTWIYDTAKYPDPTDYAAFVYKITLPDGAYYIGKKNLWTTKRGKLDRPSSWRTYWGSSPELTAELNRVGKKGCTREILKFCASVGEAGYREAELLIKINALTDPLCLNRSVNLRLYRQAVEGYYCKKRRAQNLASIRSHKVRTGRVKLDLSEYL